LTQLKIRAPLSSHQVSYGHSQRTFKNTTRRTSWQDSAPVGGVCCSQSRRRHRVRATRSSWSRRTPTLISVTRFAAQSAIRRYFAGPEVRVSGRMAIPWPDRSRMLP